jgi:hypothetical protein
LTDLFPNVCGRSQCVALEWDAEGKTLAILHGGACHEVLLWDFGTKDVVHVDLNVKEPTFMKWFVGSVLRMPRLQCSQRPRIWLADGFLTHSHSILLSPNVVAFGS